MTERKQAPEATREPQAVPAVGSQVDLVLGAGAEARQRPECQVPPLGWRCTRGDGHEGPCAAVECPEELAMVERAMQRLREKL